ncbi:iron uptake transporter permease EfeU [Streptomyces shenzhenensis]|uniref:iron uptake transporter permease EfeU n=1 Tax=Streptomyces shenzhenensis TaxID=943815 RepID=UPI0033E1D162
MWDDAFPSFLIGLREGLEGGLIVSILVATLVRADARARLPQVWTGVLAAVALAMSFGAVLTFTAASLSATAQETFGGTLSVIAVAFVTAMVFWMRRSARSLSGEIREKVTGALAMGAGMLIVTSFLAVGREGLETALFLWTTAQAAGESAGPLTGAGVGLVLAAGLCWGLYRRVLKINLTRFFTATGAVLVVIAAGVLGYGLRDLQEGGVLPGRTAYAVDLGGSIDAGAWYSTLVQGVFNLTPTMTWLQVTAYVAYLAVVMTLFTRRARTAPPKSLTTRERSAAEPSGSGPAAGGPLVAERSTSEPTPGGLLPVERSASGAAGPGPSAVERSASESTTGGPSAAKPSGSEPTTGGLLPVERSASGAAGPGPSAVERSASGSAAREPSAAEPSGSGSAAGGPLPIEPPEPEPVTHEPAAVEPSGSGPTTRQPSVVEPSEPEPVTHEPSSAERSVPGPTTGGPLPAEPSASGPAIRQPEAAAPATREPSVVEPSASDPVGASRRRPGWVVPVAVVAVPVVLAGLVVALARPKAAGAQTVAVSESDCGQGFAAPERGRQTFRMHNTGGKTSEVYLIDPATGAVYGEIEGLAPGTTRELVATVAGGTYAWRCVPIGGRAVTSQPVTVSGGGAARAVVPVSERDLAAPLKAYRAYVDRGLAVLVTQSRTLSDDIAGGRLGRARTDWLTAHRTYSSLGAAYGTFAEFAQRIDGRPDGLPDGVRDKDFTGFHRVEYGLWHGQSADRLKAPARQLADAVAALRTAFPGQDFDPGDLPLRAHEILENTLQFELTGDTDEGSGTNLATADADLRGTRELLTVLRPLLTGRAPKLLPTVDADLARLQQLLDAAHHGTRWTPVDRLDPTERARIDGATGQLLEDLAPIPDLLEIRKSA